MPSNFAAVTTSLGKGRDVGARHQALGSGAIRSGRRRRETGEGRGRDRLGESGRRDRGRERDREKEEEKASEEVGRKGKRGGQIKYR